MGCYDVWCVLCGCPLNSGAFACVEKPTHPASKPMLEEYRKKKQLIKLSKWLYRATAMIYNKKPIHGLREVACNIDFEKGDWNEAIWPYDPNHKSKWSKVAVSGLVAHTDCWKYAKKKTKHGLVFENFDVKKDSNTPYVLKYLKYRPADRYWDQDFDIDELLKNKADHYIVHSPLSNTAEGKKNATRIDSNIKTIMDKMPKMPSVQKKLKPNRPSPAESATLFKIGTKKKGNDGNMYIITKIKSDIKRWKKLSK